MPDPLPRLEAVGEPPARPTAAVLVLHGGRARSTESGERKRLTYARTLPFAHMLADHDLDVHVLSYRFCGRKGQEA